MEFYLRKNYYKAGSLIANSCLAASLLENHPKDVQNAIFVYGYSVGAAFQLIDDILDFESSSGVLGKPVLNDIKSGVATAPVLFAQEQYPQLNDAIRR